MCQQIQLDSQEIVNYDGLGGTGVVVGGEMF